jgi:dTMP kinase
MITIAVAVHGWRISFYEAMMFFVFDGIDGAGKSTQLTRFVGWLQSQGHDVVTCKDPGSTELGDQLRELLLRENKSHPDTPIHILTEMMMFTTARTQLVQQIINPALAAGKTVVLDRYILSTVVYQGHAGDLNPDDIWTVNRIATAGRMPDATFVLDLDVETAISRLGSSLDRMESRGSVYFEKVRAGFLAEAERWPTKVEVINASQSQDEIQAEICELAMGYLRRGAG